MLDTCYSHMHIHVGGLCTHMLDVYAQTFCRFMQIPVGSFCAYILQVHVYVHTCKSIVYIPVKRLCKHMLDVLYAHAGSLCTYMFVVYVRTCWRFMCTPFAGLRIYILEVFVHPC